METVAWFTFSSISRVVVSESLRPIWPTSSPLYFLWLIFYLPSIGLSFLFKACLLSLGPALSTSREQLISQECLIQLIPLVEAELWLSSALILGKFTGWQRQRLLSSSWGLFVSQLLMLWFSVGCQHVSWESALSYLLLISSPSELGWGQLLFMRWILFFQMLSGILAWIKLSLFSLLNLGEFSSFWYQLLLLCLRCLGEAYACLWLACVWM